MHPFSHDLDAYTRLYTVFIKKIYLTSFQEIITIVVEISYTAKE